MYTTWQEIGFPPKIFKRFPDFPPNLHTNLVTISKKFYLEHKMIIQIFLDENHNNF